MYVYPSLPLQSTRRVGRNGERHQRDSSSSLRAMRPLQAKWKVHLWEECYEDRLCGLGSLSVLYILKVLLVEGPNFSDYFSVTNNLLHACTHTGMCMNTPYMYCPSFCYGIVIIIVIQSFHISI